MRKTLITTALLALLGGGAPLAFAQADHDAHHGGASAPAEADAKLAEGTVKKIDKAAGKVTVAHGPLTNLGMNMPMTMAFRVKDAAWLDQMKNGDKIRFAADNAGGVMTVIKFEPAR